MSATTRRPAASQQIPGGAGRLGLIERLGMPAESFRRGLSTMMLHHLPEDVKRQRLAEIGRVLKPSSSPADVW